MSKKIIGLIIIIIGILLLSGMIYGFFINPNFFYNIFNKKDEVVNIDYKNNQDPEQKEAKNDPLVREVKVVEQKQDIKTGEEERKPDTVRSSKDDLIRMSSSFSERFGSYSNQSDYSNLSHLMIFMSEKMKKWAEDFIEKSRIEKGPTDIYYGITTRAVKAEMVKYDEDSGLAEVLVNTRRKEANISSDNQSNSFSQDVSINFIKENGVWKVDSARWQ